jgi:hypothetical protein
MKLKQRNDYDFLSEVEYEGEKYCALDSYLGSLLLVVKKKDAESAVFPLKAYLIPDERYKQSK